MPDPIDPRTTVLDFYPHRHVIETRSTDRSDYSGHIPNSRIAEFGDEGRYGLHRAIVGQGDPSMFMLVESRFRFLHELCFPGPVAIGVGVVAIGKTSIRQVAGYFRDGRCHVLAHFALVKVVNGASVPLTQEERRRAEPFVIESLVHA